MNLTTDSFYDEVIGANLDDRKIIINYVIDSSILESVVMYILLWNQEDELIPVEKRKPIWLYIQSAGGNAFNGLNLIDVIQNSKTPVYGVCYTICASMAFNIFIACHKRYAFPNSVFLMHEGEIGVQNVTSKAKETMDFLDVVEQRIKVHVLNCTDMDEDYYDSVYEKELYMFADTMGKEKGYVDYIIGTDVELDDIL